MTDQRFLITGGAGLVGSHIADLLVREHPTEVRVLDNFSRGRRANLATAAANGPVTVIDGDVCDSQVVADAMRGVDVVFHQAAIRITQCADEPRLAVDVLVNGTMNVVEAALASGVRKVVAASSASIYGMADHFPTSEQHHPYNNRTLYGAAKLFNEGILSDFQKRHGLDSVLLRYFNVYGPRMDIHGVYTEVLARWMERIEGGQQPIIFGTGTQTMDLVYVEDIARANLLAARTATGFDVFNVGTGREVSLHDLATTLAKHMGADVTIEYRGERAVNPVRRRLADTRKATEVLGFTAQVGLDEGLGRLVRWWRAERARERVSG